MYITKDSIMIIIAINTFTILLNICFNVLILVKSILFYTQYAIYQQLPHVSYTFMSLDSSRNHCEISDSILSLFGWVAQRDSEDSILEGIHVSNTMLT